MPFGNVKTLEPLVTAGLAFANTVSDAGVGRLPPPLVGVLVMVTVVGVAGATVWFP